MKKYFSSGGRSAVAMVDEVGVVTSSEGVTFLLKWVCDADRKRSKQARIF